MIHNLCFLILTSFSTGDNVYVPVRDISYMRTSDKETIIILSNGNMRTSVKESITTIHDILVNKKLNKVVCL